MTPAQLDHLNRIKRHLETLLANAEKRTPGEWQKAPEPQPDVAGYIHVSYNPDDAAFIASCAGNAETGWRSTLAAIEWTILLAQDGLTGLPDRVLKTILAAWPLESLNP